MKSRDPAGDNASDRFLDYVKDIKSRDARWYLDEYKSERAKRVNMAADRCWHDSRGRRDDYARYWAMYMNQPIIGLTPRRFTRHTMGLARRKLSLNACRSVCDAYVAKVTNQNPRVSFSCNGATWDTRQRAKRLENFNDGMLYEQNAYELGRQLELDAAVVGTAVQLTLPMGEGKDARIVYERDSASAFFCDDEAAYNGDPREMYRRKWMDRLQAMAQWPDAAEAIAKANRQGEQTAGEAEDGQGTTDTVCITWAWHLPAGRGIWGHGGTDTGDGMLVITCGDAVVCEEPCTRYPFEFLYVSKPAHGVWGDGFVSQLMPIQIEIDTLLNMIRVSMKAGASLRWLIEKSSAVNVMHLSDQAGSAIGYSGTAPMPVTPPAVAQEVYLHLDRLWQRAFEVPGISQLSAQSQKPAGLNSGKALQTYADIESERFQVAFHLYQTLFLRMARQTIALARELSDENPSFMVKVIRRKTMKTVRWADANLNDDDFAMKEYATSAFALTPEARMQQVQDSLNSGSPLITPKEARRLLNDPDLDAFDARADASYNLVMDQIEDILEHGKYSPPVDKMDLQEALKEAQFAWLDAYRSECPQERLDMLDTWIQQVIDLTPPLPPPPMPMPMPGMPPGPGPVGAPAPMQMPAPPMAAAA